MKTDTDTKIYERTVSERSKQTQPKAHEFVKRRAKFSREFLLKCRNDWILSLAGLLAYNLLMATVPMAIALVAILGLFLGNATIHDRIVDSIATIFPSLLSQQNILTLAFQHVKNESGLLLVIGTLLALFLGSRLFMVIEECFAIIYRLHTRPAVHQNVIAVGMLLLFIVLIPILVFGSTIPVFVLSLLSDTVLRTFPGIALILRLGGLLSSLLASFILFETIYFVIPNQRISFKNSWRGAAVGAIAVVVYLEIFPLYAGRFLTGVSGPIGFTIILLLFFYYFAIILLLGAEINAVLKGVQPIPHYLPNLISHLPSRLKSRHSSTKPFLTKDTVSSDLAHKEHTGSRQSS